METVQKKRFFYGWVVIGALFLITMFPMVFISSFYSYYQVPVCEELGSSYVQFSASNIASTVAGMLFSIFVAGKLGKGNIRLLMFIGGLVAAAGLVAQSYITAIWQLYITFFIVNFAFSAMTYVPINILISQWFVDRKGLVTSIVFAGAGLGGMLFSKLAAGIIANQGWRMGFRVTAIITAVAAVVVLLLVRKTPQEMGLEPYRDAKNKNDAPKAEAAAPTWAGLSKGEAVKTAAFWLYALCLLCCGIVAAGIFTQVPTYLIENGLDYAPIMAVFSGAGVVIKLVTGPIIDKLGIQKGSVFSSVVASIALICLIMVTQFGSPAAYACMVIIPFGTAITSLAPPLLTGLIFGYKDYGGIYGLGNALFMGGCMIGPMLSSGIRSATGSYVTAWIAMIIVFVLLAVFAVLAVNFGKRIDKSAV